jgi:hypothetical protein
VPTDKPPYGRRGSHDGPNLDRATTIVWGWLSGFMCGAVVMHVVRMFS